MSFVTRTIVVLGAAGLVGGCVARPVNELDATGSASASMVVTAQELAGIAQQGTLMDALRRLRPGWLQSRGATPTVLVDGGPSMELSYLHMIPASTVLKVQLERSTSSLGRATIAPNGDVVVGGNLIVVTTRRGGGGGW